MIMGFWNISYEENGIIDKELSKKKVKFTSDSHKDKETVETYLIKEDIISNKIKMVKNGKNLVNDNWVLLKNSLFFNENDYYKRQESSNICRFEELMKKITDKNIQRLKIGLKKSAKIQKGNNITASHIKIEKGSEDTRFYFIKNHNKFMKNFGIAL